MGGWEREQEGEEKRREPVRWREIKWKARERFVRGEWRRILEKSAEEMEMQGEKRKTERQERVKVLECGKNVRAGKRKQKVESQNVSRRGSDEDLETLGMCLYKC